MEPRISMVTLGVDDLVSSRRFYEKGLGWKVSGMSTEGIIFFQAGGLVVALFGRNELTADANLPPEMETGGSGGMALAHNVGERAQVDEVLEEARRAGATILKEGQEAFWGGYSGYFTDPDGHLWEVAWNPHFILGPRGEIHLPG